MKNDILVKLRLAAENFSQEFNQAFDKAKADAEKAGEETTQAYARGIGAQKAALIAAVGAAGVAAVEGIRQSLQLAGDLDASAKQIGVNVEELQKYRFAASKAGVTAAELDDNIAELTLTIGEANAGNRKAQQAFADLGVGFETTSGKARGTEAVLVDVAQRLVEIDDPSERARLGTQLLGEEFDRLIPMLPEVASGMRGTTAEMSEFGGVLSQEEIKNLNETNAKIERMKLVLSVNIARVVSENSHAIQGLANTLLGLANAAASATSAWRIYRMEVGVKQQDSIINGWFSSDEDVAAARDRKAKLENALVLANMPARDRNNLMRWRNRGQAPAAPLAETAAPSVTGGGGAARRRGGGVGGGGRGGTSAAQRERERAAKEAARAEEQFTKAVERSIQSQEDSARIERIRADQGEVAAAEAEARLDFIRQYPLATAETVEEYAKELGISRELTKEERARFQLQIDRANLAEDGVARTAVEKAQAQEDRQRAEQDARAEEAAKRQADILRREHEAAIMDVADIYEDLFTNGVDSVWDNFRKEGLRIVAEVAAQWTLAMVSGQQFNLQGAAGGALGRSPLASLFGGIGGVFAANDNQPAPGVVGGGIAGGARGAGGWLGGLFGVPGDEIVVTGQKTPGGLGAQAGGSLLDQIGFTLAAAGVGSLVGGNSGTGGTIGSTVGAVGGRALGTLIGGPVGGQIGSLVGAIAGNLISGIFKKSKYGGATIDGSGVVGDFGNSGSRRQAGIGLGGSVNDTLGQIAEALGADLGGGGRVSIGLYKDNYRVSTSGSSKLGGYKGSESQNEARHGLYNFGQDEQAAIEFATKTLIQQGVLTGISQASQNILAKAGDLEAAIEKAVLIESVPRLLKERLDPLGASMDALYDRFKKLADALKEGGASAEQIAEARQLWELEKADAISSIGAASAELKDFLLSLNAGSNSPLSLRQQRSEAEAQLATYEAQIAEAQAARAEVERLKSAGASDSEISAAEQAARIAAGKIDQGGFAEASQLLLGIDRGINASGAGFFNTFDRIRNLTNSAIGLVDGAQPGLNERDPFAELTATNTTDMVNLMVDTNNLLKAINDNIRGGGGGGFGATEAVEQFFTQRRGFAS